MDWRHPACHVRRPLAREALFRRGKALLALGDSARASADLRKVLEAEEFRGRGLWLITRGLSPL